MSTYHYPAITERVRAMYTDFFVFGILLTVSTSYLSSVPEEQYHLTLSIFLAILVLYEPLFTSIFGGTIGHLTNGIRVRSEKNEDKNLIFPLAVVRFIFKITLGWISLLSTGSNEKNKTFHDIIAQSVVIFKEKKKDSKDLVQKEKSDETYGIIDN